LKYTGLQSLINSNFVIEINLFAGGTGIHGLVQGHANSINILGIRYVLRNTRLDLGKGGFYDPTVHLLYLVVDTGVVITRVVYEYHAHDTIEIIGVLVIDRNTGSVFERLSNPTLKKIFVKIRKEEGIQWSLTLLDRIKVSHLI
jgi:hypothetical protein